MRIGLCPQPHRLVSHICTPHLCESQKESLVCRQPVNLQRLLTAQNIHQRHVRQTQPAIIGNVLAFSQLPVQLQIASHNKFAILFLNAAGPLVELFRVGRRPPVHQIAFGIELSTLIVKAVRQFVPNYSADTAVVHCIVKLCVVERRLQNARRKIDVVHLRIVIRIHRWWCHLPLLLIHGLADLS